MVSKEKEFSGTQLRACPEPALRRLPLYYQYLKRLAQTTDEIHVSCPSIAKDLNLLPIQVRKDIEITGIVGRPKLGYDIKELKSAIEAFLGWNNTAEAFLVGAGNLGSALLGYQGFGEYGLNILAAFDTDPKKIGRVVHGKKIFALEKLKNLAGRMNVSIGILAVSGDAAQAVAEEMVRAGIKGIWNFAPVKVRVPADVIVQHENLAASLAVLSKKINLALVEK